MLNAFLLILVAIFMSVTAELLLKSGMDVIRNQIGELGLSNFGQGIRMILSSPRILGGFGFFGVGALFWLAALSRVSLSWAYPMLSIGYILVLLFSAIVLKEQVSMLRWAGVLIICLGIVLVGRS